MVGIFSLYSSCNLYAQTGDPGEEPFLELLKTPSDQLDSSSIPKDPTQLLSFLSKRAVLNQRNEDFIFRGVKVIYRKKKKWKVKRNRCVKISNGKIKKMRHRFLWMPRRGAIKVQGAKGKFLAPGLIDMHMHFNCDQVSRLALLRYGVTSIRNFGYHPHQITEYDLIANRNLVSPTIYNGYRNTRPWNIELTRQAGDVYRFLIYDNQEIYKKGGPGEAVVPGDWDIAAEIAPGDAVEIVDDFPLRTVEGMGAFISPNWPNTKEKLGMIPLLKESDEIWNIPCGASSAGPWNVPGFIGEYYSAYHGVVPAAILEDWRTHIFPGDDGIKVVADMMQVYHSDRVWILAKLIKEEVPLLVGSEAGAGMPLVFPGFSVHEELKLFQGLGMKRRTLLDAVTTESARCLREEDVTGRIARGLRADLVLLDKSPLRDIQNYLTINGVMANGFWLGSEELGWIQESLGEVEPIKGRRLK